MSGYDDMVTPFVPKENWEGWSEDFIHVREVLPDDELEKLRAACEVLRDALDRISERRMSVYASMHDIMVDQIKTARSALAKFDEMMGEK